MTIYVGDHIADLEWTVAAEARQQLRNMRDLIEPGRKIVVRVAVIS